MAIEETGSAVRKELRPEERLIWSGKPLPARLLLPCLALVAFGIILSAIIWFVILYVQGAFKSPGNGVEIWGMMQIPGLLFTFGLIRVIGPQYLELKGTTYGIINTRVIIVSGYYAIKVRSYPLSHVGRIRRTESSGRTGSLYFERTPSSSERVGQQSEEIGLLYIRDVRTVERLLKETLAISANEPTCERLALR